MDFRTRADISNSLNRIEELLQCDIFEPQNSTSPLVTSALTELVILVRDLMAKAKKYAAPVEFADDVNATGKVKNVSDAIKFVRDAVCHVDSGNHDHEECNARLSFNIAYGKWSFAKIGPVELKSDYEDDVCFFFGSQKLYLKRHIIRAYEEARKKLLPLMADP